MSQCLERIWYPKARPGIPERIALSPLTAASWAFRAGIAIRSAAYRHRVLPVRTVVGTRIVSIGNLNVGGAGKTPVVIYLAELCLRHGRKVAVISRGYGRQATREVMLSPGTSYGAELVGDEPLLISQRCPAATVFVGSDRVRLAERARDEAGAKIILLDDGMQHRRLERDLEIAVIDQAAGFGNGRLLPRGPLREPVSALRRADLLWINRGESNNLLELAANTPRITAVHAVGSAVAPDGSLHPLSALAAERSFVFAAVARPRALVQSWKRLGLSIQGARFFADHHFFQPRELDQIRAEAGAAGATVLATTEKDRVRLPKDFPAWALRLEVKVVDGMRTLLRALEIESSANDER